MELPPFSDLLSTAVNAKTLLVGSGAATILGLSIGAKKVGLIGALTLAWRSALKTTYPLSVRTEEIKELKKTLLTMQKGQYITVIGGKGNGKSCLVDTTLNRTCSVVKTTSAESGLSKRAIIDKVLRVVTGIDVSFVKLADKAQRVLFFHNIMFKRSPIVVIRVPERQAGEPYAQVTPAVRELADEYGLRLVVDGSPNSVPPELLDTKRSITLSVEPMSQEIIESIPEFQDLIVKLRNHELHKAVWQGLGGCPADYNNLQTTLAQLPDDAIVDTVKNYLTTVVARAGQYVRKSSPNTKAIVRLFREKGVLELSASELEKNKLAIDYPNKVFREVTRGSIYVEPVTSAVGLIIRDHIDTPQDEADLVKRLLEI